MLSGEVERNLAHVWVRGEGQSMAPCIVASGAPVLTNLPENSRERERIEVNARRCGRPQSGARLGARRGPTYGSWRAGNFSEPLLKILSGVTLQRMTLRAGRSAR